MICTCECGGAYAMLPVTADGSHGGLNRKPSVQTQTKQRAESVCELEVSRGFRCSELALRQGHLLNTPLPPNIASSWRPSVQTAEPR